MAASAHTPGGYGGVPQSVGREFNQADQASGILRSQGSARAGQKMRRGQGRSIAAMSNALRRFNK